MVPVWWPSALAPLSDSTSTSVSGQVSAVPRESRGKRPIWASACVTKPANTSM